MCSHIRAGATMLRTKKLPRHHLESPPTKQTQTEPAEQRKEGGRWGGETHTASSSPMYFSKNSLSSMYTSRPRMLVPCASVAWRGRGKYIAKDVSASARIRNSNMFAHERSDLCSSLYMHTDQDLRARAASQSHTWREWAGLCAVLVDHPVRRRKRTSES